MRVLVLHSCELANEQLHQASDTVTKSYAKSNRNLSLFLGLLSSPHTALGVRLLPLGSSS
eukprot:458-Pelagomonas_calceolata.AAC.3